MKGRILIVDDEPDITIAFKLGLESSGFETDTYNDPLEALSNFKAGAYDLLLLDIKMPNMTGFELFQRIQMIDDKVKVCFVTAFEVYYEALKEVFPTIEDECFIQKPIKIQELTSRIEDRLAPSTK